jgi:hypothetical protein
VLENEYMSLEAKFPSLYQDVLNQAYEYHQQLNKS